MGKFKVGDKVIPSKRMLELCGDYNWPETVKAKVEEDGYLVISQIYGTAYMVEGLSCITFIEDWLDPYIEQGPLMFLPEDQLSVRDRFAMAALKGLLSSGKDCVITEPSSLARVVYSIADAMMEARKK